MNKDLLNFLIEYLTGMFAAAAIMSVIMGIFPIMFISGLMLYDKTLEEQIYAAIFCYIIIFIFLSLIMMTDIDKDYEKYLHDK